MQGYSVTPLKHNERKAWEKFYKQNKPWRGWREIDSFIDLVKKGSLVLDAGSGTGKSSYKYCRDYRVILLDFSMNSLRNSNFNCNPVLGDIKNLPFNDNTFDAVISVHIFEHLLENDRHRAMDEIYRVLKNNGYIFIESFSIDDFRFGKGKEIEKNTFLRGNGIFTHYFEREEFFGLLNNFHMIKIYDSIIKRKIFKQIYKTVSFVAIGIKK